MVQANDNIFQINCPGKELCQIGTNQEQQLLKMTIKFGTALI